MSKVINVLVAKIQAYYPAANVDSVRKAYEFSAQVHKGQKRASGEPYLIHPMAVAEIIADLKLDVPSIVAALLHDTVEDTLTSKSKPARTRSTGSSIWAAGWAAAFFTSAAGCRASVFFRASA